MKSKENEIQSELEFLEAHLKFVKEARKNTTGLQPFQYPIEQRIAQIRARNNMKSKKERKQEAHDEFEKKTRAFWEEYKKKIKPFIEERDKKIKEINNEK